MLIKIYPLQLLRDVRTLTDHRYHFLRIDYFVTLVFHLRTLSIS